MIRKNKPKLERKTVQKMRTLFRVPIALEGAFFALAIEQGYWSAVQKSGRKPGRYDKSRPDLRCLYTPIKNL
jgi:hypothetical protein